MSHTIFSRHEVSFKSSLGISVIDDLRSERDRLLRLLEDIRAGGGLGIAFGPFVTHSVGYRRMVAGTDGELPELVTSDAHSVPKALGLDEEAMGVYRYPAGRFALFPTLS